MTGALRYTHVLDEIAKHAHNAIMVTDLDQKILYSNKGFSDISGYTFDEIAGKRPSTFLQGPDTDLRVSGKIGAKLRSFERVNERLLNYDKGGNPYWLQLDIFPVFDASQKPTHYMSIQSVVTDLKEKEIRSNEYAQSILQNINYARKLQDALFRKSGQLDNLFPDSFVIDLPRDNVGGDFYLVEEIQRQRMVFLGDCTGHGVSGAIMTAMCVTVIKDLLRRYKNLSPSMILNKANVRLNEMLRSGSDIHDGMEGTIVFIDDTKKVLRYATEKQKLFLIGKNNSNVLKGDKQAGVELGKGEILDSTANYEPGDLLVVASDGYIDQMGQNSDRAKRIGSNRLHDLLSKIYKENGITQKNLLLEHLFDWQGSLEDQTDDILVIGLRLN